MNRIIKALSIACLAIVLTACATAPGQQFSGVSKPATDKADIYLYRGDALFAVGQAFSVEVNGAQAGELFNASYLKLQLPPGEHTLTVSPGPLTKSTSKTIRVQGGQVGFYEYSFVNGPLANVFFLGAEIEPREEGKALADLKSLKAARM
jgi:hypothetical protein